MSKRTSPEVVNPKEEAQSKEKKQKKKSKKEQEQKPKKKRQYVRHKPLAPLITPYKVTYGPELKRLIDDIIEEMTINLNEGSEGSKNWWVSKCILQRLSKADRNLYISFVILSDSSYTELSKLFDADYHTLRSAVKGIEKKVKTYLLRHSKLFSDTEK